MLLANTARRRMLVEKAHKKRKINVPTPAQGRAKHGVAAGEVEALEHGRKR